MLNVMNTLAIGPFLDVLMFPIGGNDRFRAVARCIWVKNPYVKICILQNPLALMSRRASSVVMAVRWVMDSPLRGCNRGSVATLWHTSDSSEAVISRNSLCLIVGKPPIGQIIA